MPGFESQLSERLHYQNLEGNLGTSGVLTG